MLSTPAFTCEPWLYTTSALAKICHCMRYCKESTLLCFSKESPFYGTSIIPIMHCVHVVCCWQVDTSCCALVPSYHSGCCSHFAQARLAQNALCAGKHCSCSGIAHFLQCTQPRLAPVQHSWYNQAMPAVMDACACELCGK